MGKPRVGRGRSRFDRKYRLIVGSPRLAGGRSLGNRSTLSVHRVALALGIVLPLSTFMFTGGGAVLLLGFPGVGLGACFQQAAPEPPRPGCTGEDGRYA